MEEREVMQDILIGAGSLLQEIVGLIQRVEEIRKKYLRTEGRYTKPWHGVQPIRRKLLIIFAALLLQELLDRPISLIVQNLYYFFGFSVNFSIMSGWIVRVFIVVLVVVLAQCCANKKIIAQNQKEADLMEYNKQRNIQIQKEETAVRKRLEDLKYKYFTEYAAYIPPDYRYDAGAVRFFASAFTNGRADTLKEAVNLYETDQYRKRMEQEQKRHNLANEFIEFDKAIALADIANNLRYY